MAGIRNKNTQPELLVRKHLHSLGFRYRLQKRIGKSRPDLVLPRWKTCIFVHGCYWHRHKGCKLASTPQTNTNFWEHKFNQNVARDKSNILELRALGWSVGVIWECSVRNDSYKDGKIKLLIAKGGVWILWYLLNVESPFNKGQSQQDIKKSDKAQFQATCTSVPYLENDTFFKSRNLSHISM